jgi:hypothetical protein
MACQSCKKTKDIKLNQMNQHQTSLDALANPNIALFETSYGRFLYFMLLMFVALTPIINLVVAYMFYKAVYGFKKQPKAKDKEKTQTIENAQVNKDTNNAQ